MKAKAKKAKRPECAVKNCKRPVHAKNICQAHYRQQKRNGEISSEEVRSQRSDVEVRGIFTRIAVPAHERIKRAAKKQKTSMYHVASGILEGFKDN